MNKILKVLILLPAILFLVIGLRWLVDPAGVAPSFGLALSQGLGLSSQVGDMAGFFLTTSICMLIAVIGGHRIWFYPPVMLLSITALGRIVAWLVHDAGLATEQIAVEVIVSVLLLIASRRLPAAP
ncbi:MAG: hypothetical protein HN744_14440 [Halieaceae bacterium]|jgi:hypothetical protein|nr:hypothetical protein [Halieaceae bacterium]MBT5007175.1 hypothetical protein [Halieaceae bacterium]MBT6124227.1 hypothetical protein [Halieaceae bacterium]MBT7720592.1 hypothetical protein [Halieaceae bacterium]